jgi:tetratricopeptide (TPR) repeat protein
LGLLHFIISLYFPFLKFNKFPNEKDNEIVSLYYKKCKALVIINPKRFLIESFYFYKKFTKFDFTKFGNGVGMFASASALFYFTGISFRLSRKILDFVKEKIDKKDERHLIAYDLLEMQHNYFRGNWDRIGTHDDDLVKKNLNVGEIWFATQHYFWHGCPKTYQGRMDITEVLVNKLENIYEIYENDLSLLLKYMLNAHLLMKCRKFSKGLIEIQAGIDFAQKMEQGQSLIHLFSFKAQIYTLMGNMEEAKKSLESADQITRGVATVPWQLSSLYRSQSKYDLYRFEDSVRTGSQEESSEFRKRAIKSINMLSKLSKKVASHCTESYKLKGVYYWLMSNQKKALKCWYKAIEKGESLEARLELARIYFEVGKRLLTPESKYKFFNGIKAEEYLEKARLLFEEMKLEWDLDELRQVAQP